jgi:hypothetical protein
MTDEEQPAVRYFSVEEANALLPTVAELVRELREAHEAMEERQDDVTESIPTNGGGTVHREFLDASTRAAKALDRLQELGIVVRDPSSGLVDFPAVREGQEVFLCWRLGEDSVAWFHPPETGFAGRQPL